MQVKCPDCGKISFETTDQYDSDKTPHGGMLRLLPYRAPWGLDWLTNRHSGPSVMTCPVCEGMLVRRGKFVIVEEPKDTPEALEKAASEPVVASDGKLAAQPAKGSRSNKNKKRRPVSRKPTFVCPKCGKVCGSEAGLASHRRHCKE